MATYEKGKGKQTRAALPESKRAALCADAAHFKKDKIRKEKGSKGKVRQGKIKGL